MSSSETCDCPHCGEACDREEVDVGVGTVYGPWRCPGCGWSAEEATEQIIRVKDEDIIEDRFYWCWRWTPGLPLLEVVRACRNENGALRWEGCGTDENVHVIEIVCLVEPPTTKRKP